MPRKIQITILLLMTASLVIFSYVFIQKSSANNALTSNKQTVPILVEAQSPNENASVNSPDGKVTLTMKKITNKNSVTFSFFTDNLIYSKVATGNDNFSVPFNTWSPDNKYVFIKEDLENEANYLVFPGEINVTNLFKEKLPDSKLGEVTGWAAPNLLIVNTNMVDGKIGASYWFDINTKNFTRLSNKFY